MLLLYTPDARIEMPPEFVEAGMREVYEGQTGLRELSADLHDAFEMMLRRPQEIVDAGDRVVALGTILTRARVSGVELEQPIGDVGWLKRGLITRQCIFLDQHAALEAVGLAPQDAGS
jgi:hypothetical protein